MTSFFSPSPSASSIPAFSLHNGVQIPCVAFGLCFGNWAGGGAEFQGMLPERSCQPIDNALKAGYHHFDGAHAYSTQRQLGDTLVSAFSSGVISRNDLFITTKVGHPVNPNPHVYMSPTRTWNPRDYPAELIKKKVMDDFDKDLEDLGVGYVDLLLIHWPGAFNEKDETYARQNRQLIWRAFEELYKKKAARAIGVSNFTQKHVQNLIEDGVEVLPMVNQLEMHPYCQDRKLVKFCQENKIVVEAYAPFASGNFNLFQDAELLKIAQEVNRSVGQVILRWHHQHGHIPLPKSSNPGRAKENLCIFNFELTAEQMQRIDALHPENQPPKRACPDPSSVV